MNKQALSIILSGILLISIVMISSCKKDQKVTAKITVEHDTLAPAGLDTAGNLMFDTITGPVQGAEVRLWAQTGSEIDTVILTDAQGLAEISFDQPLILRGTVTHFSDFVDLGPIPMDEEGDVWEETVNLDH